MNRNQVVVHGRLKPDGTLELDAKPPLPEGPVEIVIRSVPGPQPGAENWWGYLQRARSELEAAGHRFRTREEIDTEIEELRSGDERFEQVYRGTSGQQRPEQR